MLPFAVQAQALDIEVESVSRWAHDRETASGESAVEREQPHLFGYFPQKIVVLGWLTGVNPSKAGMIST